MSAQEAASRSLLLYAYVFGSSLMICDSLDHDLPQLKQNIAELLAGTRLVRDDPS